MHPFINTLKSNRSTVVLIGLVIWLFASIGIITGRNKKVDSAQDRISELEAKVKDLAEKLEQTTEEKEELATLVSRYQALARSYRSTPNYSYHGPSSPTYSAESLDGSGEMPTISGVWAQVMFKPSGCDYMVLSTAKGHVVAEWMGGHDPDTGESLIGNFNSYGTKDFFTRGNTKSRLYVDDYMLSKDSAVEKIRDKCN